jgi:protein-S-isoprenylcysteine O-methyltransferase Ste14
MSPLLVTLIGLCVFFAVEFLFTPFSLGKKEKKDQSSTLYVLGVPIISGILCGALMLLFSTSGNKGWWNFAGLLLMCAGIVLRVIAKQTLGEFFAVRVTLRKDHKLITKGVYRYIRHPLYLGMLLIYASVPFLLGLWWVALIVTLPCVATILARVNVEEKALEAFFGKAWQRHANRAWWF